MRSRSKERPSTHDCSNVSLKVRMKAASANFETIPSSKSGSLKKTSFQLQSSKNLPDTSTTASKRRFPQAQKSLSKGSPSSTPLAGGSCFWALLSVWDGLGIGPKLSSQPFFGTAHCSRPYNEATWPPEE